jgi:LysM repeat protein
LLNTYAEGGKTYPLVIGDKKIGSVWRVTNVSSSWDHVLSGGELLKASLNVSIEENEIEPMAIAGTGAAATTAATSGGAAAPAAAVTTYTVVKGDNLWNIAKKFYGSGVKYTIIFNANRGIIKNPSLIYPGQVLTIPMG